MKNAFATGFGVLMAISFVVWIFGGLAGVIVPWFGGIRAETLGQFGFVLSGVGEGGTYLFGWLYHRRSRRRGQVLGIPGPKKYGNKPVA